ncbi:tRNA (adenosine(37)-N6)-dimethylallyltransferase MiaA [Psychroflexus montanilacus]|uniref:tRNA (adenosine(37)-N6)-dimethylallyltransferase MiaA n=1 Tax=Psychroflexus montanilacus TaxID=2873598 RepID=UPI001CC9A6D1|nr:tRNA (adenosine(37)-N6)-dimethylallyltransferase MiaA [Psychroflexus montanilacus]MBZ9651245.1 tRNA (adenosine(37)-N6)-dimethylallyltransferase MiaA [Psychroflexus montanilacus]
MQTDQPTLICIVGPTAIGKTSLSLKLANQFSTEILSADSRQFYKEMTIGTAVPSEDELAKAQHHFIQHLSIEDEYNVGKFEADGIAKLQTIFKTKSKAILVGGSGLYQKAITEGLDTFPEIPLKIRQKYTSIFETEGLEKLQALLKENDPEAYNVIEISNPRRLTRALEVVETSGKSFTFFQNQDKKERPFEVIKIGLDAPREVIYRRIEKRVDMMIEQGLVEEAKRLYPSRHLNALQTVGYRELFSYFDGKLSLAEAISEIKKNTRRFAKRQLTWFKKDPDIHWFHFETPLEDILFTIENKKTNRT